MKYIRNIKIIINLLEILEGLKSKIIFHMKKILIKCTKGIIVKITQIILDINCKVTSIMNHTNKKKKDNLEITPVSI